MVKSKLSIEIWIAGVILFFFFGNLVGTPTVARTTRLARVAGMERMSTDSLNPQVTLQISLPVNCFLRFRVQNVVHATEGEDRTPHSTHHRRKFSRARDTSSTHMRWLKAQGELSIRVCIFSKSSCRHMFHRNLLGVFDPPPLFPTTLVTESGTNCAEWLRSWTTSLRCLRDATFRCLSSDLKCSRSQACWVPFWTRVAISI